MHFMLTRRIESGFVCEALSRSDRAAQTCGAATAATMSIKHWPGSCKPSARKMPIATTMPSNESSADNWLTADFGRGEHAAIELDTVRCFYAKPSIQKQQ